MMIEDQLRSLSDYDRALVLAALAKRFCLICGGARGDDCSCWGDD